MSWGVSVSAGPASSFEERARAAYAALHAEPSETATERDAQFEAALKAAAALMPTVQPRPDGQVTGSLNGHANPGHAPRVQYANDCVSVAIYQFSG